MTEIRYYFPKWRVLCTKSKETFDVINGGWSFTYNEETKQRMFDDTKELVDDTTDTPVKVTKEEFKKMQPHFGHW